MKTDVWCAICGGPFYQPSWEVLDDDEHPDNKKSKSQDDEDEDGDTGSDMSDEDSDEDSDADDWETKRFKYNPKILKPGDGRMKWLRDGRVIGTRDQNYKLGEKCWSSGPAYPVFGAVFACGEHGEADMYGFTNNEPVAFPYHQACRTLLERYFGSEQPVDDYLLYEVFESCFDAEQEFNRCLCISYGGAEEQQHEGWFPSWDWEHSVCNPVSDSQLENYYANLPRLPGATSDSENDSWITKIKEEQPWLFDIPDAAWADQSVDWHRVYEHLDAVSNEDKISPDTILGLANRRRLWTKVFDQFKDTYLDAVGRAEAQGPPLPALSGAECTGAQKLLLPDENETPERILPLVSDLSELATAKAGCRIYTTASSNIVGIDVLPGDGEPSGVELVVDDVYFQQDDWVTGFIFTFGTSTAPNQRSLSGLSILFARSEARQFGSIEGAKSIIYVKPDHFIVGLITRYGHSGMLSRLSLIEQPLSRASQVGRIIDNNRSLYNTQVGNYLWARELPPPCVYAQDHGCGYGSRVDSPDTVAVEALVFGSTDEELSDIVALSADVQMGGFQVRYASRPTKSIGPRLRAMKTLRVDGQGGERIVSVQSGIDSGIQSVRFVTNRQRQLAIFTAKPGQEKGWPVEGEDDETSVLPVLAGIYCWWDSGACRVCASHPPELNLVGGLIAAGVEPITPPADGSRRPSEMKWEPDVLPPGGHSRADGEIWGRTNPVTAGGAIVNRLDCSRPLSKVRVTLCHDTLDETIPLAAVKFTYVDGGEMSAGPSEFPLPPDPEDWCCLVWEKGNLQRYKEDAGPHYRHETWDVGGQRLKTLRIWTTPAVHRPENPDRGATLAAIQLVTEEGSESPVWSYEGRIGEGDGLSEVCFGDGKATGIVFYMSDVPRNHGRDTLIRSIQALIQEDK